MSFGCSSRQNSTKIKGTIGRIVQDRWSHLGGAVLLDVLATSNEATPRPPQPYVTGGAGSTVSWCCQFRSELQDRWGPLYSLQAEGGGRDGPIGVRALPGPSVVVGPRRAA